MKKVVKFLQIILLVIALIIPITIISINSELIIGDEIWNFQNIMKMINGGKIYVDSNVITTPIFHILGSFIVKYLGANILGFRIYNIALFLILILSSFLIFRTLKIDKIRSMLYTLFIFLFLMPYISVGANYNVLAVALYFVRNCIIFK